MHLLQRLNKIVMFVILWSVAGALRILSACPYGANSAKMKTREKLTAVHTLRMSLCCCKERKWRGSVSCSWDAHCCRTCGKTHTQPQQYSTSPAMKRCISHSQTSFRLHFHRTTFIHISSSHESTEPKSTLLSQIWLMRPLLMPHITTK